MTLRNKSIPEPVRPTRTRYCFWCEKDELYVPLQDCMGCQDIRDDGEKMYCGWVPGEKVCEGCGIPAEYCEPNTCPILQAIKKSDRRRRGR
jgi:hypothetical protein